MSEPLLHWIDGESVASVAGTTRTGTDPSTGRPGTQVVELANDSDYGLAGGVFDDALPDRAHFPVTLKRRDGHESSAVRSHGL